MNTLHRFEIRLSHKTGQGQILLDGNKLVVDPESTISVCGEPGQVNRVTLTLFVDRVDLRFYEQP